MTEYYDIVLGLIPLSLLGITATTVSLGLPMLVGIVVGATIAIALIGHAMFVNTPVSPTTQSATHSTSEAHRSQRRLNAD